MGSIPIAGDYESSPGRVGALLREGADRLAAAGVASPRADAELLLAAVLGLERPVLAGRLRDAVDTDARTRWRSVLARREAREPLQHIIGAAPFRHLLLAVGPGVFIPRPETELLVDAVLPALRSIGAPVAVDLCAGSGALALAIATEVPTASVFALERSPEALTWLRRNADGAAVTVVPGDVTDRAVLADLRARVDVVVSNPPYVPTGESVSAEVLADPAEAVFSGPDGLGVLPAVIARAADLLRPGGVLAVEHHESHADAVPALLAASEAWAVIEDRLDLAGRPRYSVAVKA